MRLHHGISFIVAFLFLFVLKARSQDQVQLIEVTFDVRVEQIGKEVQDRTAPVARLFRQLLESRDSFTYSDKPQWVFIVGAVLVVGDEENIALSILSLHSLPEEIIELGVEREAYYVNASDEQRAGFAQDEVAKRIRAMMTEEYMRSFLMPQEQHLVVVNRSELAEEMDRFIELFMSRHMRFRRD